MSPWPMAGSWDVSPGGVSMLDGVCGPRGLALGTASLGPGAHGKNGVQAAGSSPGPQADPMRARCFLTGAVSMSARPLPATCLCPFSLSTGMPVMLEGDPLLDEPPSSTLVFPQKALFPVWPPSDVRGAGTSSPVPLSPVPLSGPSHIGGPDVCTKGRSASSSDSADFSPAARGWGCHSALPLAAFSSSCFFCAQIASRLHPLPNGLQAAPPFDSGFSGNFRS